MYQGSTIGKLGVGNGEITLAIINSNFFLWKNIKYNLHVFLKKYLHPTDAPCNISTHIPDFTFEFLRYSCMYFEIKIQIYYLDAQHPTMYIFIIS